LTVTLLVFQTFTVICELGNAGDHNSLPSIKTRNDIIDNNSYKDCGTQTKKSVYTILPPSRSSQSRRSSSLGVRRSFRRSCLDFSILLC
jgi:hypothetical protein